MSSNKDIAIAQWNTRAASPAAPSVGVEVRLPVDVVSAVLVGGNHLASQLVIHAGADFATKYPAYREPQDVLEALGGDIAAFDMWCAWSAITLMRTALSETPAPLTPASDGDAGAEPVALPGRSGNGKEFPVSGKTFPKSERTENGAVSDRDYSYSSNVRDVLRAIARLQVPAKPQGNAGAYSLYHDTIRKAQAALAHPPASSPHDGGAQLGWLYENPDTGTEWSDQHPVESGEVDGAQNVRPATLQNLKDELLEAWRGWDEARAALSTLSSQAAARQMTAPPDRSEPESR
jgi:hypothetical protein